MMNFTLDLTPTVNSSDIVSMSHCMQSCQRVIDTQTVVGDTVFLLPFILAFAALGMYFWLDEEYHKNWCVWGASFFTGLGILLRIYL